MSVLAFNGLSYAIGDRALLREAELALESGERVALIGRNGAGKSTLLRILEGELTPDAGDVRRKPGLRVSRLEQTLPEVDGDDVTVSAYVASGLARLQALVDRYEASAQAAGTDAASLKALEALHHEIDVEDGWNLPARVESILKEMGLPGERPMSELSGGWRRRAALARGWVSRPELLLLDEPTNHLDVSTIEWLEERLLGFSGALLFVTHDRAFLERLATRIVELDRAQLTSFPGDYASYLRRKEEALETEARADALFDKRLAEEEAWIRRGIKARRTRNEGRVRALEAMRDAYAARVSPEGRAQMTIERADASGKRVVELEGVAHGYGDDEPLFRDVSLRLLRGDRLGLVGNNGVGKTTLLRILLGEIEPRAGKVKHGVRLEIVYLDQLRRDLDETKSIAELVGDGRDFVTINGSNRHIIGYLKGFLFTPERAVTKIAALSGGERNRVVLAHLFARPSNVLVLDEPTNDLDLETLEVLEDQLMDYRGTLIVVSHDRAFLDNIVSSTLVFEESGVVTSNVGGYSDWLRKGKRLAVKETEAAGAAEREVRAAPAEKPRGPKKKLSYKAQRELDALPAKIKELEDKVAALEAQTTAADFYTHPFETVEPILEELATTKEALDKTLERWLELENELH